MTLKEDGGQPDPNFRAKIKWPDTLAQFLIHTGSIYGIYIACTSASFLTIAWVFVLIFTTGYGITAGVHRLWSHRSFKAKFPLRFFLAVLFSISGQRSIFTWALYHRVHHKYCESDADPHDARRGFWFSHVGWLCLTPHPDVVAKLEAVDVSDLLADPIVFWQTRLIVPLFVLLCVGFPVSVPVYLWQETIWNSFWLSFVTRFCILLNIAYSVNSFAHMYGNRPYDKSINARDTLPVTLGALGEGWHNYHHVFPWDYRTSELGCLNPTTRFIDWMARLGQAYQLKAISDQSVKRRAERTGDGSRPLHH